MKQITIIMSLAISIFVLSGCNGKGDDKNSGKEECDKKGADWIWNVTEKKCEEAVATKEECDKKGTGWMWDEANKKCNQKTAGLSDKQKCKAKGVDWTWDETDKQCNEENLYMTITIPSASDNDFQVAGNRRYFEYLYFRWSDFQGSPFDSSPGECVKIHKSNLPWLVVGIQYHYVSVRGKGAEDICYNSPDINTPEERVGTIFVDVPMCLVGNYILTQRSNGKPGLLPLLDDAVDVDSCREYLRSS